jgi:ABC-2 type transport system permease protein
MWRKISLIFQREYITRVRKRSFIILTILAPLGFGLIFVFPLIFANINTKTYDVLIVDDSNILQKQIADKNQVYFTFSNENLEKTKKHIGKDCDGVLFLPQTTYLDNYNISFYSNENIGMTVKRELENQISEKLKAYKIEKLGLDKDEIASLESTVSISEINLSDKSSSGNSILATALAYFIAMLIYVILIIYGTMVMKSISEEKNNRIVEIIISSVKPFELLLGKIFAVGAVGLTQFAFWLISIPLIQVFLTLIFHEKILAMQQQQMHNFSSNEEMEILQHLQSGNLLADVQIVPILMFFILFFFFGYLMYASIFAAIGSIIGDDGENQSLTFIGTAPIVISVVLLAGVVNEPNSSISTVLSFIPFFSPILMIARLPFQIPLWQPMLSLIILAISAFALIWVSGRIYRVGIMMYGKKVKPAEIVKWIFSNY